MNNTYSLGIGLKIINLILITVQSLLLVKFSKDFSSPHFCFLITSVGAFLLLPFILLLKINLKLTKYSFVLHILRAIFNCSAITSWILALKNLGANEATAVCYTIPIFTSILACFFCKEKLDYRCVLGICFGVIGTLIILKPSFSVNHVGALYAIISAFSWACYDIVCKKQTKTEHYLRQVFYNFLFSTLILLPFAIFNWRDINLVHLVYISIISILSATNVVVLFLAYKLAPLILLMPFSYLRLLFMSVTTYFLFEEVLSNNTILGVILISCASAFVFWKQHKGKISIER